MKVVIKAGILVSVTLAGFVQHSVALAPSIPIHPAQRASQLIAASILSGSRCIP
jgi:hypothetical protein